MIEWLERYSDQIRHIIQAHICSLTDGFFEHLDNFF